VMVGRARHPATLAQNVDNVHFNRA
jgi:hypothetical protein